MRGCHGPVGLRPQNLAEGLACSRTAHKSWVRRAEAVLLFILYGPS